MQRAWMAYRDTTCQFYDDKIQGSMATAMHAACVTRESARRALLLKFFTGLPQPGNVDPDRMRWLAAARATMTTAGVKPGEASTPMKNVSISGGCIFHAHAS
jgi:hypothetical protein